MPRRRGQEEEKGVGPGRRKTGGKAPAVLRHIRDVTAAATPWGSVIVLLQQICWRAEFRKAVFKKRKRETLFH